jgi:predicted lipoprotein with Yx(FWY)xxD motif
MTLYIFTKDRPDQTTCTGGCAQLWPPLTVSAGQQPEAGAGVTGRLGTLVRPDGGTQVTYDGMPLYYYSGDTKAGDTTGQGQGGVWFLAPASGSAPAAASSPNPSGGRYSY